MNNQELRKRRKALGITQEQAAELLGVAFQTYNIYENKGKLTKTKALLIERVFSELEQNKSDSFIQEPEILYQKSDKKENQQGILENILFEIQNLRKENEQLQNTITHFIDEHKKEMKLNEIARTQFEISVDIIKNLDKEFNLMKKSASTKKNIGDA